jgi:PIN domain nuclease of toxin-antitoxin system
MKQFIQYILMAAIFLISFNHSVSSEVIKQVYVEDLQSHLSAAGYDIDQIDGEWGQKSNAALVKYLQDNSFPQGTKISVKLFKTIRASLGDKAPLLKGEGKKSPYFIRDASSEWGELSLNTNISPYRISVNEKLKARKTINAFKAWNYHRPVNGYGLYWESGSGNPRHTSIDDKMENRVSLLEVYWYASYNKKPYPGIKKHLTKKNWIEMEHGKRLATKIIDPNFQDFIINYTVKIVEKNQTDGVLFDWWANNLTSNNGYSKNQNRKARIAIAKKLRKKLGPDKIIMGNVNWRKDKDTVDYINGVFLELTKKGTKRTYKISELKKIESSLNYYEKNLQPPKLVALAGWRKTKDLTDEDRNTPENRKMAKLLTAMSVVINTNGYILYGDNNQDSKKGDYDHIVYDFYSFDIGTPTSGYTKVKSGVGYKEHKQGFIAYNITNKSQKITRANGQKHQVAAKSGLFCKDVGSKVECLSVD